MGTAGVEIPGPPKQPDGGLAAITEAGGLHNYQLRMHEEYGPVVRFQLPGAESAVSVADPVLLEATASIDKRPEKLFEFLTPLQETGNLQTLPADEHTPLRRLLLSVLAGRPSHEAHFAQFVTLATDLADRWAARAAHGPVELQKDLSALSLRMICEYALGSGLAAAGDAGRVVAAFEDVLTEYLGRLYQVETPGTEEERGKRAEEALAYLRGTVDRVLDVHRVQPHMHRAQPHMPRSRPPAESGDIDVSDLVAALDRSGERPARIRDTVLMIMMAAHHTTGVAVSWTLHLLGRHPEVADRVAAELDRELGERAAPDYADLKRLRYLDMVLKESMRLYPPGPYGAREATEDLVLGEYAVPAGTTIFYPFWAVHMNPRYWPEPDAFIPERFTPEETAKRPRYSFIPFGLGPRSCEGAGLAMVEAELILAVLLKRFRCHEVPGHQVTPIERFVLWAAEDIQMTLTPRRG